MLELRSVGSTSRSEEGGGGRVKGYLQTTENVLGSTVVVLLYVAVRLGSCLCLGLGLRLRVLCVCVVLRRVMLRSAVLCSCCVVLRCVVSIVLTRSFPFRQSARMQRGC